MPGPSSRERNSRIFLLVGGLGYLVWWGFVRLSLPNAFNPIGSRLAVVACFLGAFTASLASEKVLRRLDSWLAVCCAIGTLHYFYLFDRNGSDLNWVVGSYITVTAVCAVMQTAQALLYYSFFVAALSIGIVLRWSDATHAVFLPGMITNLAFANVGLRARFRLLDEVREGHESTLRELTERKRAEAALVRANAELEAFSYSVAHDLRSPLRGINGFSRLLAEEYRDEIDDEGKEYLDRIAKSADRMATLIDSLLALARIARSTIKREPIDLTAHAESLARDLEAAHPGRKVEVAIQANMTVEGDSVLVRTLLDNLLTNAWKFTARTESARVAVGCAVEEGVRVFHVADNGAGFDMAHAKKLFGPFQRLHAVNDFPGDGIGLATVQRIVERHGGSVWGEGVPDEGAKFSFTLEPISRG